MLFSADRPFCVIFGSILAYVPLFLFLENHSIFSHGKVYRCSWCYSDGQYTFFDPMSISAGGHFGVFLGLFFHVPLFLENCAIFYYEIVYTCAWQYSDGHFTKKYVLFHSAGGQAILGFFLFWLILAYISSSIS